MRSGKVVDVEIVIRVSVAVANQRDADRLERYMSARDWLEKGTGLVEAGKATVEAEVSKARDSAREAT